MTFSLVLARVHRVGGVSSIAAGVSGSSVEVQPWSCSMSGFDPSPLCSILQVAHPCQAPSRWEESPGPFLASCALLTKEPVVSGASTSSGRIQFVVRREGQWSAVPHRPFCYPHRRHERKQSRLCSVLTVRPAECAMLVRVRWLGFPRIESATHHLPQGNVNGNTTHYRKLLHAVRRYGD